jgi:hypothetical protein
MKVARNGERPIRETILLFFVLAIALSIRLVYLDQVPTNVMPDEADNMVDAYHILTGTGPDLIGLDWTQLPALNVHIMAFFLRFTGLTVVGMRMAVVVTSTLALLLFYLLARRIVEPVPALLSTLMFATSLWYLNFSRTAWSNVHVVLFELLAIYFLVRALDRQKWYLYILAGGGIALTLYGYYAGRATMVAVMAYLPIALYLHRGKLRSTLAGFALMLAVAFLLFQPQLELFLEDWEYTNRRVESVSIFHQKEPYLGETDPARLLALQTERMLRGFLLLDGSVFQTPRYTPSGSPPVDYATGMLYLAGLLIGLMMLRHTALWYLLLFVPLIITQVFSIYTPDSGRAIVVTPAIYLFVAVALQLIWRSLGNSRLKSIPIALAIAVAAFNIWWYFDWAVRPETAKARQPAVEYAEFERWQELQMERALKGEPGFTVHEWHKMRQTDLSR